MEQYEIMSVIAQKYGLALGQLVGAGGLVTVFVAAIKQQFPGLAGQKVLIPTGVLSFLLAFAAYQPEFLTAIISGVIIMGASMGWWGAAKQLAHKVGTPSTSRPATPSDAP